MATLDERTAMAQEWGLNGFYYENGTTAADTTNSSNAAYNLGYTFCAIHVLEDTKFHTLTFKESDDYNGDMGSFANSTIGSADTIPAGTVVYGTATKFTLHVGKVIAYYSSSERT